MVGQVSLVDLVGNGARRQLTCSSVADDTSKVWSSLKQTKSLRKLSIPGVDGCRLTEWVGSDLQSLSLTAVTHRPTKPLSFPRLEHLFIRFVSPLGRSGGSPILDLDGLESLADLSLEGVCPPLENIIGVARALKRCALNGVDNGIDGFLGRHCHRLESLSLKQCQGAVRADFPQLRAVHLSECDRGIMTASTSPILTHIYINDNRVWFPDPCREFLSSLQSSVESFLLVANQDYRDIPLSMFEPLVTAPRLQDLELVGLKLPSSQIQHLDGRQLRTFSHGRRWWEFSENEELSKWDLEHYLIPTRRLIARDWGECRNPPRDGNWSGWP